MTTHELLVVKFRLLLLAAALGLATAGAGTGPKATQLAKKGSRATESVASSSHSNRTRYQKVARSDDPKGGWNVYLARFRSTARP
ncbi:MAG: hypothetical protein JWQ07_2875 [Ramlibacter sp.]|nr:hypothetical protein [Ramlibacter sp.]